MKRALVLGAILAVAWVYACGSSDQKAGFGPGDDDGGEPFEASPPEDVHSQGDGAVPPCALQVTAGAHHTCALKSDGSLACWGRNDMGQSGSGAMGSASAATVTALGKNVTRISAGAQHTCAVKQDGTLWCFGSNASGQLGIGTSGDIQRAPLQVSALGTDVRDVACGTGHTCAKKKDGSLWCWGDNAVGQLGVTTDGGGVEPSPIQVTGLGAPVLQVSAGSQHTCAVLTDNTLFCWGDNTRGQIGDGTTTSRPAPTKVDTLGAEVAAVSAGGAHTCAVRNNGTVSCWGANGSGELGDGTTNGMACGAGPCRPVPSDVMNVSGGVEVGASIADDVRHSCGRRADGAVYCWGNGSFGELGVGNTTSTPTPAPIPALDAVAIAVGAFHGCAIRRDGTVACWGLNGEGEVGDGTFTGTACGAPDAGTGEMCRLQPTAVDGLCPH